MCNPNWLQKCTPCNKTVPQSSLCEAYKNFDLYQHKAGARRPNALNAYSNSIAKHVPRYSEGINGRRGYLSVTCREAKKKEEGGKTVRGSPSDAHWVMTATSSRETSAAATRSPTARIGSATSSVTASAAAMGMGSNKGACSREPRAEPMNTDSLRRTGRTTIELYGFPLPTARIHRTWDEEEEEADLTSGGRNPGRSIGEAKLGFGLVGRGGNRECVSLPLEASGKHQ